MFLYQTRFEPEMFETNQPHFWLVQSIVTNVFPRFGDDEDSVFDRENGGKTLGMGAP